MRCKTLILLAMAALSGLPLQAKAGGILGTAETFAVLGGSTVTNTGPSVVGGDLGVYAGTAIVGFPPGTVTPPGATHAGDAVAHAGPKRCQYGVQRPGRHAVQFEPVRTGSGRANAHVGRLYFQ